MKHIDCTPDEAAAIVSTIHGDFTPEEVENVIFIVQRKCPNCGEPHILTVTGTPASTAEAANMMAQAISRIMQEGTFDV